MKHRIAEKLHDQRKFLYPVDTSVHILILPPTLSLSVSAAASLSIDGFYNGLVLRGAAAAPSAALVPQPKKSTNKERSVLNQYFASKIADCSRMIFTVQ